MEEEKKGKDADVHSAVKEKKGKGADVQSAVKEGKREKMLMYSQL